MRLSQTIHAGIGSGNAMKTRHTTSAAATKIRGVDFVMYRVSDLARAVEFYRDVLGLALEMHSKKYHWAEFDGGNVTLALYGGEQPVAGAGARVALAVDDIAEAHAKLTARGVRLGGPPQDWGVCQSLEVFDPDGNALLLHHRADGTYGAKVQATTAHACRRKVGRTFDRGSSGSVGSLDLWI